MARITKADIAANAAAELAATQQAELKRMRAEKRAAKREADIAAHAHAEAVQPEAVHANIDELVASLELPSASRVLVGFVLGIASAFSVGYGIGMLLSYALAGIAVLTTSAWLAFMLSVLTWIVALYAGWVVGGYIGGRVFSSVVMPEGLASRSYDSVANAASNACTRVGSWFSAPTEKFATFTGAFTK